MAESGFPSLPSGTAVSKPASGSGSSSEQVGRIINIPDNVRSELAGDGRTIRVRGEIVRVNEDNSVRVRTARGDVDVQLSPPRGSQPRPQVGQRVEIEIQPAPVRQPSVQTPPSGTQESSPSPSSAEQVILRSVPARTPAQVDSGETRQVRPSATPVDIQLRPATPPREAQESRNLSAPAQASTISLQGFPVAGSLIRLEALTPEQTQRIITTQAALPADSAAQVLQGAAQSLNVTSAPVTQPDVQPALVAQQSGAIQSGAFTLPETQNFIPAPASLQSLGFPDASAFVAPKAGPQGPLVSSAFIPLTTFQAPQVLQVAQLVRAQENNFTPALAQDTIALPLSGKAIDARITKIDAPLVQITPPQSGVQIQPATLLPASLFQAAASENGIPLPQTASLANSVIQNQQAGQVSGIVVGKTEYALPVLVFFTPTAYSAFPAGVIPIYPANEGFALTFPHENIPVGTQIHVTPQAPVISAVTSLPLTGAPLSAYLSPQSWPLMDEVYQSLLQIAPPMAQGLSAHVPNPSVPAQFGAAVLFFVSAVRGGDLNSWLGDKAVEALRQNGKGGLLSRLGQEGALLNRISSESMGQDWRAMSVPLFWDGEIHRIALHFRHEHGEDNDKAAQGAKGTRFVFDLSLSAMGNVQVDGLFRPVSPGGPRLDVILRTQQHFSGAMQAEMRRVYMDALRPSQVSGELSFQNANAQWVTIEAPKDTMLGVDA